MDEFTTRAVKATLRIVIDSAEDVRCDYGCGGHHDADLIANAFEIFIAKLESKFKDL